VRTALITGVAGQDGSYLAELLLGKGYRVVGLSRGAALDSPQHVAHLGSRLELVEGDLRDRASLERALAAARPDEVYNLAAQSVVHRAWTDPIEAAEVNGLGAARLLEAVRQVSPATRVLQASSSEIFGAPAESPQRETTPIAPRTPYGVAKAFAHWTAQLYRESFGMFVATVILYNHESPRRSADFVTGKVARAAARIAAGLERQVSLGSLDARRDWGFAGDYVDAMWRALQQPAGADYVVGTGELHTVRELCEVAFAAVDLDWREHVRQDPALVRPVDATAIVADATKARTQLGWTPTVMFEELVRMMVHDEVQALHAVDRDANE
jgi:GDPmannose 4,6-dehydratase